METRIRHYGRYGNVRDVYAICTVTEYGMYGVDTRVAVVSLKKSHPFYLNLPLLLYIIVIMSYYGGWYHYGYF